MYTFILCVVFPATEKNDLIWFDDSQVKPLNHTTGSLVGQQW